MPKHGRPSSRSRDDFLYNHPISAPWGTMYTKPLNVRIVGGKYVPSSKTTITFEPETMDLHHNASDLLTDRSQNQRNFSNVEEKEELLKQSARHNGSMNRHAVLPAIGNGHEFNGSFIGQPVDIADVYSRLPRDTMVSVEPLLLTEDEEIAVMREIKRELQYFDHSLLSKVSADLQRLDRQSSGFLPFQDLQLVLSKNRILLPPRLLRLMGCIFVSRIEQGTVNYHRILTFVSDALKGVVPQLPLHEEEHKDRVNLDTTYGNSFERPFLLRDQYQALMQANSARPEPEASHSHVNKPPSPTLYYQAKREDWMQSPTQSPRGDAHRTIRQLQGRLPHTVNVERLRFAFQRADRYHRGTLSELQIREICSECLQLGRDVVDMLIAHVPARGGGQYNWQSFIDLLERIQPVATGLRIPESKRPLEYARSVLQPAPSWPAPEPSPSPPPSFRPQMAQAQPPELLRQPLPPLQPQDAISHQMHPPQQMPPMQPPQPLFQREDTFRSDDLNAYNVAPNYIEPSGVIAPMETMYPNPVEVASEPWHNRFMKFVEAVYRQDQNCTGFVDESTLRMLTREYNATCHLNLSDGTVAEALSSNRKNLGIHVHGFLMSLANIH